MRFGQTLMVMAVLLIVGLLLPGCASSDPVSEPIQPGELPDSLPTATPIPPGPTPARATAVTPATAVPPATAMPEDSPTREPAQCRDSVQTIRTDVRESGNRLARGTVDIATAASTIPLPSEPAWVLPWNDDRWYVVGTDGLAWLVSLDGQITKSTAPPAGEPPLLIVGTDGPEVRSAWADHGLFENPLPDTRVVSSGNLSAALVNPTDRYDHAVLGDALEASAVEILDHCSNERSRIEIAGPNVIEGISPMFADMTGDGVDEIVITTANDIWGARVEVWTVAGERIAATDPINRGRRWRNQLGAADLAPGGGMELVDVRTPHLSGLVEFFWIDGDRLVRSAKIEPYTSHVLGSRNLDMGVLIDVNADAIPEVLVLTRDRRSLAALERIDDDETPVHQVAITELSGIVTTNLAIREPDAENPRTALAVGTSDSLLHVWSG